MVSGDAGDVALARCSEALHGHIDARARRAMGSAEARRCPTASTRSARASMSARPHQLIELRPSALGLRPPPDFGPHFLGSDPRPIRPRLHRRALLVRRRLANPPLEPPTGYERCVEERALAAALSGKTGAPWGERRCRAEGDRALTWAPEARRTSARRSMARARRSLLVLPPQVPHADTDPN